MTTTTTTATPRATATTSTTVLRAFQTFAALTALTVLFQFITAGRLFPDGGPVEAHAAGAIVLHVMSGVTAIAAFLLWRQKSVSTGLLVLAGLVFASTFVQAATGGRTSLAIHVPGAMLLTAGAIWLLVVALRLRRG